MDTERKRPFIYAYREDYCNGDFDEILTEAEKSRLIFIILQKIKISQTPKFMELMRKDHPIIAGKDESLAYYLTRLGLLEETIPLFSKSKLIRSAREGYEDTEQSDLLKQVFDPFKFFIDVNKIRDYYGDEIAVYFEWMNYFQKWLWMPAILAVFVFICNQTIWDVETSPGSGIFSIFMALWGTFFLLFWRRRTEGLNVLWDDYVISHDAEDLRKQFKGKQRIDPVTDELDTFFPWQERLPLYFQSFLICFPCWCLVLLVIVAFLNITGVIRPDHHGGFFDIPALSQLADVGNWCDPDGYLNMIMSIL